MAVASGIPSHGKLGSYRYVAATLQGKEVKGTVKATSEIAAERLIIEQGYDPLSVEAVPSMFSLEEAVPSLFKIKPRDVIIFSRQLATLLKAGIPLLSTLEILQGQVAASRAFKGILEDIVNDIRAGGSFSQAISKHPRAFNEIYYRTIAVGEQSGNLETVLSQMADYLEKRDVIGKKVSKALAYPTMVLVMGVIVVFVMMTRVMPSMIGLFTATKTNLPLPTQLLIAATNFLTQYQLHVFVAAALLVVLWVWMVRQPAGRRFLDRLRLTLPVIGPPTLMMEMARFSRMVSVLVGAGVRLQEIMEMVPQSAGNRVVRDALTRVKEGLLLGEGFCAPMQRIKIFPPLLVQMVAVGEESNTLAFTMGVVADFYETTAEEKIGAMVGMIGPAATIAISLLVGFIALSVIMPMYTITGAFG